MTQALSTGPVNKQDLNKAYLYVVGRKRGRNRIRGIGLSKACALLGWKPSDTGRLSLALRGLYTTPLTYDDLKLIGVPLEQLI